MMISYTLLPVLLLILGSVYRTIDAASFRCYDESFSSYMEFSLDNPTPLINSSCYNSLRDTIGCTHGFNENAEYMKPLAVAYSKSNYNVIVLDWAKEASSGILGPAGYPAIALLSARTVGEQAGRGYALLQAAGVRLVGLTGFSLGVQVKAYAARRFRSITGKNIPWLQGLDPAGPLYDGVISLRGIDAESAGFVELIHTNPGRLGSKESQGTVDIWPNCGNPVQPRCANVEGGIEITSPQNKCSHNSSRIYEVEAIQRPGTFIARFAESCDAWRAGQWGNQTITLGLPFNMNTGLKGNFYLDTNSVPFYGKGEAGSYPN